MQPTNWQTRCPRRTRLCALSVWVVALAPVGVEALPVVPIKYEIDAGLDPETRELEGTVLLTWTNVSSRPVSEVPIHLYLNAFANEGSTFLRESARWGPGDHAEVVDRYDDPWGWTELTEVTQIDGDEARCSVSPWRPDDANPDDETLARVGLPRTVPPGATLRLRMRFEARLPVPIARTGGVGDYFFVAQWFPKIAVMDSGGNWAAAQFHRATEFYAPFADFDVRLEVPDGWLVAATGAQTGVDGHVRFQQRAVHDFAFVAGSDLVETVHDAGGVELRIVSPPGVQHLADRVRASVTVGLEVLGRRIAPYPYPTLTVVLPPWRGRRTAGMEYPTLITGLPGDPLLQWVDGVRLPEAVAVHELAHQYFYGLLATDERREAFLDEGFTTYWEGEILEALGDGSPPDLGAVLGRRLDWTAMRSVGLATLRRGESVSQRPSWLFAPGTSGQQIYNRTALTLRTAEARFGQDKTDAVFAAYYARHAFGHPRMEDFLAVAAEVGGAAMGAFLAEAWARPDVPNYRVVAADTKTWTPPSGWFRGQEGSRVERSPAAPVQGTDGAVEVRAPGWVRGANRHEGRVEWRQLEVVSAPGTPEAQWWVSDVRVESPGWDNLPVDVQFVFSDGAVLRDHWDGRAAWRSWRFARRASLVRAQIGPESQLAIDPSRGDDGLESSPDAGFRSHWGGFVAALGSVLAVGASLWL